MSKSKEHSYRFNREMTRAVLDGRKTQTRRLISQFNEPVPMSHVCQISGDNTFIGWNSRLIKSHKQAQEQTDEMYKAGDGAKCPYGDPGDTFRLSEAVHVQPVDHERYSLLFESDLMHCERYGDPALMERIRGYKRGMLRGCTLPPAFCRSQRWEITRRWVERIQDISEEDAIKEGIEPNNFTGWGDEPGMPRVPEPTVYRATKDRDWSECAVEEFSHLWQSIYGPESWERNDWVWCVEWKEVPKR